MTSRVTFLTTPLALSNIALSTRHYDTTARVSRIPVRTRGGTVYVNADIVCRLVPKPKCEGGAKPRLHAKITALKLIDDDWNAISPATVQFTAVDRGDRFAVCVWIGGSDGKIYLAVNCSNPDYCGAPDNQSMIMFQVNQVCK